jgi:hypothetical protein
LLFVKADEFLEKFEGYAALKPVNVRPRNRLQVKVTDGAPVRGVVWGRYGEPLSDDRGNWCGGDEFFTTHYLSTLSLIDDMSCLVNVQLHADALRFIIWAENVGEKLDIANGVLTGLAEKCDPAIETNSQAPSGTCKNEVAAFRPKARAVVSDVTELSVAMKASSIYWAASQIPFMANSDIVATFLRSFAVITTEMSN